MTRRKIRCCALTSEFFCKDNEASSQRPPPPSFGRSPSTAIAGAEAYFPFPHAPSLRGTRSQSREARKREQKERRGVVGLVVSVRFFPFRRRHCER